MRKLTLVWGLILLSILFIAIACGRGQRSVGPAGPQGLPHGSTGRVSLSENVNAMRQDGIGTERKTEREALTKSLSEISGKAVAFAQIAEIQERGYAACKDIYMHEICRLTLEIIADSHGWSIRPTQRKSGLLRDSDYDDKVAYEQRCIDGVDQFNCLSRWVLFTEDDFDICDDQFGDSNCASLINDILGADDQEAP